MCPIRKGRALELSAAQNPRATLAVSSVWRTSPVKWWCLSGFDAPARRAPGTFNAHKCFCAWILNHEDQGSFSPAPPPLWLTQCSLHLGTDMQLMRTTPLIEVPSCQSVNVFVLTSKVSVLFLFLCGRPTGADVVILSLACYWNDLTASSIDSSLCSGFEGSIVFPFLLLIRMMCQKTYRNQRP